MSAPDDSAAQFHEHLGASSAVTLHARDDNDGYAGGNKDVGVEMARSVVLIPSATSARAPESL